MTRQPLVARRAEELLGTSVVATAPVAGGDIATATRLRLSDGTTALMKTLPHAPHDFFTDEADGLRWLGEPAADGGVQVPEVLAADHECLIIRWVEPGKNTVDAASAFGRQLAATHAAGADGFGAAADGYIGKLPLPNRSADTWAEFYAVRRVLPYLKLARDRGAADADQAATIEALVARLPALVPAEPPARLHGDLWNGNVLWGLDGNVWLIDPAAYGGHREVDLAMLTLFGLPHLPRVLEAYDEAAPLADGWQDRTGLHQVFPLLVHACHFGGGYAARAAQAAAAYL
ncbi:phosphotransferase [Nocardioides sp. MAH-18]|uniref:Phosphotransferase n=1 Tax=Nocardioides agri TaxID=2682843 RepID=A0A6L6XSB1_9ACTN|nr:fructosamine kinase family protein [Nocardioides sp. CGMCC 1.13656]MBA2954868.1 fructosamine kinase family protein [Nocardioides sp. CGMCC 1.13656]MVQ49722.1 phosphotransferase [Nocardioides sp. MAH-18]